MWLSIQSFKKKLTNSHSRMVKGWAWMARCRERNWRRCSSSCNSLSQPLLGLYKSVDIQSTTRQDAPLYTNPKQVKLGSLLDRNLVKSKMLEPLPRLRLHRRLWHYQWLMEPRRVPVRPRRRIEHPGLWYIRDVEGSRLYSSSFHEKDSAVVMWLNWTRRP